MDGWITPTSSQKSTSGGKRPRDGSPEVVDLLDDSSQKDGSPEVLVLPGESLSSSRRLACQYGSKCYRRNASHLKEFSHPLLESVYKEMTACGDFTTIPLKMLREIARVGVDSNVVLEQIEVLKSSGFLEKDESPPEKVRKIDKTETAGSSSQNVKSSADEESWRNAVDETKQLRRKKYLESLAKQNKKEKDEDFEHQGSELSMLDKWKASCPFNFFLTKVAEIPQEKPNVFSCTFKDLFDPSLGEVKAAFHANFMIEMEWFMDQVMDAGLAGKNTWVIFDGDSKDMQGAAEAFPWLKINGVKSPFPFGHHHTKMSIVQYTDESVRFFIYTANLVESDWDNRTQGIWISPRCPKLQTSPSSAISGESSTKFKYDIIQYLQTYPVKASAAWIHVIKAVDCSAIKVYFVASAPVTSASGSSGFQWAQAKLDKILKSYDSDVNPTWPLVIQCSSIGTLGKSVEDWVQSELAKSMSGKDRIVKGPIRVIYPSHSNVQRSFDGLAGGGCLPYGASTHTKQPWLEKFFCQWKADCVGRSRAVPHIKGYCRVSPDDSKLAWFLLTSANLSKAAWGKFTKRGDRLSVMSWEAGVLFHPSSLTSQSHFNLGEKTSSPSDIATFPMPFDIPVTRYDKADKPWFMDTLQALIMQQQLRK